MHICLFVLNLFLIFKYVFALNVELSVHVDLVQIIIEGYFEMPV